MASLKSITPTPIDAKTPPSPAQALFGGLTAGIIALLLYKFTITVEASLNRQALSDNFSVCISFAFTFAVSFLPFFHCD